MKTSQLTSNPSLLAMACLLSFCGLTCGQASDPLDEALQRPVSLQFLETPISSVLAFLQDVHAVPVVLDPGAGDEPVTITVAGAPLGDALEQILDMAGMAYVQEQGVLYIADRQSIEGRRATVRAYVVSDLLSPVEDFAGRWRNSFELARDDEGGFGISAEEGVEMIDIEMLMELIVSTVSPESWDEDYATFTSLPDLIVIRQTPEVHEAVAALLARLREGAGEQIAIEARYYALPADQLEPVLGGVELLDAAGRLRLHRAARLLHGISTAGFNSQRFSAHTGGAIQYVRDYDVEVAQSAACFDPIISTVLHGMQLDIRPILGPDQAYVTAQLRIYVTAVDSEIERIDPTHAATVPTAESEKDSSLFVNGQAVMGVGSLLHKPTVHLDGVRTYTRIPIGSGRVFVRSSELVEAGEVAVLVVTARLAP